MRTFLLFAALTVSALAPTLAQTATKTSAPTPATIRSLIDTGHTADALAQIALLPPAAPGISRLTGLAYYATGDLRQASTAFAEALKQDRNDTESAQMRALTLFRMGRPADAIPLLEASRSATANSKADPNYILALCYIDTRRYDDARHAFAAQYGFPSDSAASYLLAARMLLRREYLPVAQADAEKAVALDPAIPLAHELLGEIALAGNHLDEAIAQFELEKSHNPLEPSIYDRLGDAYNRAARYDDAQRALQAAVLLEPNATGPYILLGKTMLKKNDPVAAATYLERANKLDPANFMTHSLLGQAYRAMGRREDATREAAIAQKIQAADEPKLESVKP